MTKQQAIKTLTSAGWVEFNTNKDYSFEKNNKFVVVDKGNFSQIGSQPIPHTELAALCRLTEGE